MSRVVRNHVLRWVAAAFHVRKRDEGKRRAGVMAKTGCGLYQSVSFVIQICRLLFNRDLIVTRKSVSVFPGPFLEYTNHLLSSYNFLQYF